MKEFKDYKGEFEINQDNEKIINETVKAILEDELKDNITSILLFGSFVDKSFTKRSDIDVCIVFNEIKLKEATEFRIRISGKVSAKIDIQVFNILPMKVKKEILKNHKVLYKTNKKIIC